MTAPTSLRGQSAIPALMMVGLFLGLMASPYIYLLSDSRQRLMQVQDNFERVAWIAAAEPAWRTEFDGQRRALQDSGPFLRAAQPQNAAAEMQSRIRQELLAAGGTVESLQSNVVTPNGDQLPAIRAVIVSRVAPERILPLFRALEAIQPALGIESVEITTQQIGGKDSPQRMATLTIAVRTFVLEDGNGGQ